MQARVHARDQRLLQPCVRAWHELTTPCANIHGPLHKCACARRFTHVAARVNSYVVTSPSFSTSSSFPPLFPIFLLLFFLFLFFFVLVFFGPFLLIYLLFHIVHVYKPFLFTTRNLLLPFLYLFATLFYLFFFLNVLSSTSFLLLATFPFTIRNPISFSLSSSTFSSFHPSFFLFFFFFRFVPPFILLLFTLSFYILENLSL